MAKKNQQHLEEVMYECYQPIKLPTNYDKKLITLASVRGRVIIFADKHQPGFYHKGLLKDIDGESYYVEWCDPRVERNREKTVNQYRISDLVTLIARVF